ncbi:hypothetical protein OGAPHI_000847 [Ogataea philodendri]|uniref:Uncharacterized protein n=1 Tax=Ogataea philodendri TaxID=1378263 RepID=A0A9P8TAI5_9ASCO|nr:uncharacterized protein OGAPHI_000847 [Ogataea philodendri]KAH3671136.1 hypothetical protein OGAPHI_000847 [Ogataea philodendri]
MLSNERIMWCQSPQTALATYFLRRKNAPAASKTPTAAISGNDEPDDDDELAAAAGFIVAPPLSSPTTRPPRISRASSECPISSNGSVASVPAQSRITSSPPGCSSKYDPQSYTFPL